MKEKELEMEVTDMEPIGEQQQFGSDCWVDGDETPTTDNVAENESAVNDKQADDKNEWQDKYLRLSAEFDNYRKRTAREKMELRLAGGEDILKSLLPVADDLDRAAQAVKSVQDVEALSEGVMLILKKFFDTLKSKGVDEIECIGKELDTDLHEAIAKFPVEEREKRGKIIDVAQKGYKYNDKVIRHAKVVIGE